MLTAMFDAFHILAVLATLAGLLIVMVASKPVITAEDLRSINIVYSLTAVTLVLAASAGLMLWLGSAGKPSEFYSGNPIFHAKMGLFGLVLLLAAYAAHRFRALQRQYGANTSDSISVAGPLRAVQKLTFILALILPVLAWLMARGIGY
jgi:putative membrane protein